MRPQEHQWKPILHHARRAASPRWEARMLRRGAARNGPGRCAGVGGRLGKRRREGPFGNQGLWAAVIGMQPAMRTTPPESRCTWWGLVCWEAAPGLPHFRLRPRAPATPLSPSAL
eukprot:5204781-Prymnesium_polylepis.2